MKVIKNIFWLFVVLAAIRWLWQVLEMVFYGVIQPRKVDEIISFVWDGSADITAATGQQILIVETDENDNAKKLESQL